MAPEKFLRVICPRCKNKQIVFGNSSYEAKCEKCNYLLTKSRGGKAKIRAKVEKLI